MSPPQPSRVEPKIWQCCAGSTVKIPKLHSKVYYFPLGHFEHACPNPPNTETLSLLHHHRPFTPCIISAVDLLANPHTDEVFVKLLLTPVTDDGLHVHEEVREREDKDDGYEVVSSSKILSQSDANNGGAFSVPRECAKSIFPPLDLKTLMPSQELSVTDIHGKVWEFRHVYRGTPLRHLITSNWSKFVDKKKLVCGDSLIFMKNSAGSIFVGIRRHKKFGTAAKITEKSVMEAAELADKNMAFEVVYYPTVEGCCNFVVDAKVVEDAMKINWNCGMRIKLSLKNDDSSKRCSIFQGTISAVSAPNRPWRMLEVNWDRHEILQNPKQSPWEVKLISEMPELYLQLPPTKKLRVAQGFALSTDMIEFHESAMRSFNQTLLNCPTFIDGIQRAGHNLFCTATSSNFLNDKGNGFIQNNSMAKLEHASTKLNISNPISGDLSSHNHSILNSFKTKIEDTHNCNTKEVTPNSFVLFGKTIYLDGSDLHDSDAKGEDSCKGNNEIEGDHKTCT